MKERTMLFSGPMVRAILDGRKTVTRRAVKAPIPSSVKGIKGYQNRLGALVYGFVLGRSDVLGEIMELTGIKCPYGQPGDRLWVRETWARAKVYQAGGDEWIVYRECDNRTDFGGPWKPSIHMPRNACRILLEIAAVRVERLHAITNEQCIAEGCRGGHGSIPGYIYNATPQEHFRHIWESTGGDYFANPWVWVVEFKRVGVAHG